MLSAQNDEGRWVSGSLIGIKHIIKSRQPTLRQRNYFWTANNSFGASKGSSLEACSCNQILALNYIKSATLVQKLQSYNAYFLDISSGLPRTSHTLRKSVIFDIFVWYAQTKEKSVAEEPRPADQWPTAVGPITIFTNLNKVLAGPRVQKQTFGIIKCFYIDICQWVATQNMT